MLICIQNRANSDIWPGLGETFFPLSAFQSNHHNNIHYSPSPDCLVSSLKGANAQMEAPLYGQSLAQLKYLNLLYSNIIMYSKNECINVSTLSAADDMQALYNRNVVNFKGSYTWLFFSPFYVRTSCRTSRDWHLSSLIILTFTAVNFQSAADCFLSLSSP